MDQVEKLIETVKMQCEICNKLFDIEKYGNGSCPDCDQKYSHNNDVYVIELTISQKNILRAIKEWR